ncbi:hypothetical protein E2F43_11750 [Seongchinamella unica]|uniref:OmpR/PhoB-type domain-containing protein n=1 Tax=Seongchinamella unica TaxID=2547392 RepID=A0A4R5LTA8_9GAMM|nr:winged helix-turn-helix domain-containing protein [Seongchinamella unica]TDG14141.1 hypothetical protein E2F43_11750 [Seongchinamella unica]
MMVYRIGEVDFDTDASEIRVRGMATHLQPQVSSVLACLIRHRGEVVSKDTLVAEAWKGRYASDESVTRCVSLLRAQLADRDQRHLIETIAKKGYRFNGPVEEVTPGHCSASSHTEYQPQSAGDSPKTAVNLLITAAVIFLMLSALGVASDFFTLR